MTYPVRLEVRAELAPSQDVCYSANARTPAGANGSVSGGLATMTDRDPFTKNLRLSREFDLDLPEHPEVAEEIPKGAMIVCLPDEDPGLC